MEKQEIEPKLRLLLAQLEEGRAYTTNEISAMLFGAENSAQNVSRLIKIAKALSLADKGAPRQGKGPMQGHIVHPLIWSRRETVMPEPTAYAVPPSQMTVGDVAGSLAATYRPRQEEGSFGPASPVRHIDPELEAIQQRLKENGQKLKDLEERINLLEMKGNL